MCAVLSQEAPVDPPFGLIESVVAPVTSPRMLSELSKPVTVYAWLTPAACVASAGLMVMWSSAPTLTAIVLVSLPPPPSLSVAVSATTYVPVPSGVKLNVEALPDAYGLPFFVTLQARVKPAAVSTGLGSVTLLPRLMGVPMVPVDGAPVIATAGATLFTVNWKITTDVVIPSFALTMTVWLWAGPSVVPKDQAHVPDALVPAFVTVPTDAESVTPLVAVSLSDHVPALVAVCPSFRVRLTLFAPICGGTFPTIVNAPCNVFCPPPGVGLVTVTFRVVSLALLLMEIFTVI